MTFLEGFASAYQHESDKTFAAAQKDKEFKMQQDAETARQAHSDAMQLQSEKFQTIMSNNNFNREVRQKKADLEENYNRIAQGVIQTVGAKTPGQIAQINHMAHSGLGADYMVTAFQSGRMVPNPDAAPEAPITIQANDVPSPSPTTAAPMPNAVTAPQASPGYKDPMVSAPNYTPKEQGDDASTPVAAGTDMKAATPSSLGIGTANPVAAPDPIQAHQDKYVAQNGGAEPAYIFKNPKQEIQSLPTLYNNKRLADASGNAADMRNADGELEAAQNAATFSASQNPQNQGQAYALTDGNGNMIPRGGLVSGILRNDPANPGKQLLVNAGDSKGQPIGGVPVHLSSEQVKNLGDMTRDFGDQSAKYAAGIPHAVNAVRSAAIMSDILHNDPQATTNAAQYLNTLSSFGQDISAAYNTITNVRKQALNRSQNKQDQGTIERDANDIAKATATLYNASLGATGVKKIALDAALYDASKTQLAISISAANGLTASKSSDKDFDNNMKLLGGINSNTDNRDEVINQAIAGMSQNYKTQAYLIENNPRRQEWEAETGVKTNLHAPNLDDVFNHSVDDHRTRLYWNSVNAPLDAGHQQAVEAAKAQGAVTATPPPPGNDPNSQTGAQEVPITKKLDSNAYKITGDEKADKAAIAKLKPGEQFIAPDGHYYFKN
jgi:hypothetical protein